VAVLINAAEAGISVQRRGGLNNGNYILWWNAKLANGRALSGFCEASPQDGRIVRLGTNQTDSGNINRRYRITPDDAERICQREARVRFSPGNGEVNGLFQWGLSTKSAYRVEWRYDRTTRTIRKGWCEIDSYTGGLRKFHAGDGW
jgi:hypothetical protein